MGNLTAAKSAVGSARNHKSIGLGLIIFAENTPAIHGGFISADDFGFIAHIFMNS